MAVTTPRNPISRSLLPVGDEVADATDDHCRGQGADTYRLLARDGCGKPGNRHDDSHADDGHQFFPRSSSSLPPTARTWANRLGSIGLSVEISRSLIPPALI